MLSANTLTNASIETSNICTVLHANKQLPTSINTTTTLKKEETQSHQRLLPSLTTIPLPPLPHQHPQRNHILPPPIKPNTLPRTPLHHKPKPLIQLPSALVPRKSLDPNPVQIGVPKTPFCSPEDRLGTVAFVLVRVGDGDADGGVAVVGALVVDGVQGDGADWGGLLLLLLLLFGGGYVVVVVIGT